MQQALSRTLFAVLALAVGLGVQAADKRDGNRKVSGSDRHFITRATEDGLAEVGLGKLAQQNGASQAVKDFGRRMVKDHSKANEELTAIAAKLGIAAPAHPGAKHQSDMEKLAELKGVDFDREYAEHMVKDHERAMALFEKQAKNADAAELKAYASRTLPTLKEHLTMAQELQSRKDQRR